MNKQFVPVCLMCVLLLSACGKNNTLNSSDSTVSSTTSTPVSEEKSAVSTTSETTSNVDKEAYYRQELLNARDTQQAYINSLPTDQQGNVQTAFSAVVAKATELIKANPTDAIMIDQLTSELLTEPSSVTNEDKTLQINRIMTAYSQETNMVFIQCTPATNKNYYHLSTPDQTLANVYLEGEQLSFQLTPQYRLGNGKLYQLIACYVNEDETELILFVEKDGQKTVLHTTEKPQDDKIQINVSQNSLLNQYTK